MWMRSLVVLVLVSSFSVFAEQAEYETQGQHWSVLTGKTLGTKGAVVESSVGWPGLHAGFLYGLSQSVDVGGRLTFNYGFDGDINVNVVPGLKFQGSLRAALGDNGKATFAFHTDPGLALYFPPAAGSNYVRTGLLFPVGVVLGFAASSAVQVGVTLDLPMAIYLGNRYENAFFVFPILTGAAVEYFIHSNLLVNLSLKMGPAIVSQGGAHADFDLESQVGVAYRL